LGVFSFQPASRSVKLAWQTVENNMNNENRTTDSLIWRSLLGQAVGAAGILSALEATGQSNA
jgi:uncharacterized membrane protein